MVELVAAVLAVEDVGCVGRVYQCGVEVSVKLSGRCGGRDCGGDAIAVHYRGRECERELGGFGCVLDGVEGVGGVVADELIGSVDDHLRGVGAVEVEAGAVLVLPVGELVRRETVVPAFAVPVVDVFAQHYDLRCGDGLNAVELGQQSVGRWAAGTAFGGEELHQNRCAAGFCGLGVEVRCEQEDGQDCGCGEHVNSGDLLPRYL